MTVQQWPKKVVHSWCWGVALDAEFAPLLGTMAWHRIHKIIKARVIKC